MRVLSSLFLFFTVLKHSYFCESIITGVIAALSKRRYFLKKVKILPESVNLFQNGSKVIKIFIQGTCWASFADAF